MHFHFIEMKMVTNIQPNRLEQLGTSADLRPEFFTLNYKLSVGFVVTPVIENIQMCQLVLQLLLQ